MTPWILSLAALALLAIGWIALSRRARFPPRTLPVRAREARAGGTVEAVAFAAIDGTRLEGWLFRPHARAATPLVIMAPGLGGTKDAVYEPFAWRFVEEGAAVLLFDYRCFGGSAGTPRNLVHPERHQEDYRAALAFARGALTANGTVDPRRIALWGTSFSGGTALVVSASDPDVRALVVQCPFLATPAHVEPKGLDMARFVVCASVDLLGVLPPIYVPLYGRPGEWAFARSRDNPSVRGFDTTHAAPFWRALPSQAALGWENRMPARMLAAMDDFVPMDHAASVRCPALFVAAEEDDLVPRALVEEAFARVPAEGKELHVFGGGHFNLYVGPPHAANLEAQAAFLRRELCEVDEGVRASVAASG